MWTFKKNINQTFFFSFFIFFFFFYRFLKEDTKLRKCEEQFLYSHLLNNFTSSNLSLINVRLTSEKHVALKKVFLGLQSIENVFKY